MTKELGTQRALHRATASTRRIGTDNLDSSSRGERPFTKLRRQNGS
jgi:hypothetical protein